jgi:hypothetical protein
VGGVAEAAVNSGINYVLLTSDPVWCPSPDGALPPGYGGGPTCEAGELPSNTIYVVQTETADGWRYTDLVGTGATSDDVWMAFDFEAQCRGLYRLESAHLGSGYAYGDLGSIPEEVDPHGEVTGWSVYLPVDQDNKTIPHRNIDADIPADRLEQIHFDQLGPSVEGSPSSFVELGEQMVQSRIEAGATEAAARAESDPWPIEVSFHAELRCDRGKHALRRGAEADTAPVEVVFLGVGQVPGNAWRDATVEPPAAPVGDLPMPGALAEGDTVTQAELVVGLDPSDACRLNLTGVITTNGPMTVEYRFVDEMGVGSQLFSVDVDQTQTAFLDHHVMLPEQAPHLDGGGIGDWSPTESTSGPFELVDEESDNEQGYFQLHVTSPHGLWSDIEGYNVEPCTPGGSDPATKAATRDEAASEPSLADAG